MEYSIDTCLGYKKCLYCGNELSIQKKTCLCNKTIKPNKKNQTERVKVAYPRVSTPILPPKQLEYLQESISQFVKPSNSTALPSKWMEIEVLSLDDILVDVHCYVKKLTEDDEIMHLDYLIIFKPEKNAGSGAQLRGLALDSEGSGSENVDVRKKKNAVPKLADFSEVIQQEGRVIRKLREQYRCDQHDTYFIDNGRHTKLTAMHLQC
ncbi:hypothetical protein GLOIN_2v1479040 [Rhizophagus clarus]|uniref:Uncharacterized protein n=1 Tax=Rhizophagus clarus TaxID=94130 RepID=A0A8H3QVB7_9GLOM|nr:hypothetical protein GLOIN_2v1479040 [Rhizophagus clarus]